ncbi:MAG TPA: hypothetical protein VFH11_01665 [Gemmatimonadota bacterium]|nr:hypothetical protein [Gemmatimonadota bacterium]
MTSIIEAAPYVVFGIWLGLSVLHQFPHGRWIRRIKRFDRFGVLPDWTFFAPTPIVSDYRFLYRDMSGDGTLTSWKEITYRNTSLLRSVWHPERRIQKGLNVSVASLVRRAIAAGRFEKRRLLEVSYLLILNFVEKQPRDFRAVKRQFLIAQTRGVESDDNPHIMFLSAFHVLPKA